MDTNHAPDLRYPIGNFKPDSEVTAASRSAHIEAVAALPALLQRALDGLGEAQLDTPYRPEGWSLRQVVHHLADSHLNAFSRVKLALTEERPTIKPYKESYWAELPDARSADIAPSLAILGGLHARWALLLRSLEAQDFTRPFVHPESGERDIDWLLQLYAWHGRHHTAHITSLRERMGW